MPWSENHGIFLFHTLLQIAAMKKYISLFTISLFFVTIASAQDVRKISDDFQRLMNDPKSPYGKNKVAGKY